MIRSTSLFASVWFAVRLVVAQQAGWQTGQVNSTMCYWDSPRAAVIRDTLYIDGGFLWWQPGLADGSFPDPVNDGNPLGLVYLLNFGTPFNTTASFNLSTAFTTISKAAGGGNANNIGPEYYDGAMFANDYEWITYGGLIKNTDAYKTQDSDAIAAYQKYQFGPERDQFQSGYALQSLPAGMTRYVTNGAAVSVPSENLGYYMGGLRSESKGPIYQSPGKANDSVRASFESDTLISVDFSVQGKEKWTNDTLQPFVPGRANAELVWVPVGERGILVAIGGVINPSFATLWLQSNASAASQSTAISPTFMTRVSVYDIKSSTWYEQNTTGSNPGQLTQGCTVLASAQDGSSHNIYWYGGFDGLNLEDDSAFSDDVYVLSIPTFTWVKVNSGSPTHGRAGHRCAKPYPDQMLVVGGYSALSGTRPACVGGGIIQIFNLSSTLWQDTYNPESWSNYTVPASVISAIAGKSPTFSNSSLETIVGTKYNTTKIKAWYPYALANTTDNTNRTTLIPTPAPKPGGGGTPKYLGPVLGVVLGLIFISLLVLAFVLWRRRKYFKANTQTPSEAGTMDNRRWVANWLRATPAEQNADAKAPTVTTDETAYVPNEEEERAYTVTEMGGAPVLEMEDTSKPTELSDTGFVPLSSRAIKGRPGGLTHSPSSGSQYSHASEVSRDSGTPIRPGISPVGTPRPDSPPMGVALGELSADGRVHSDISNISDSERGHLRGISETSVSTDGAFATPMGMPEGRMGERGVSPIPAQQAPKSTPAPTAAPISQEQRLGVVSPLTPPLGVSGGQGSDYLDAASGASPKRKSQFKEDVDDK